MQYKLTDNSDIVLRIEDDTTVVHVCASVANPQWQAYQAWLAADPANQPLPADA